MQNIGLMATSTQSVDNDLSILQSGLQLAPSLVDDCTNTDGKDDIVERIEILAKKLVDINLPTS